MRSVGIKALKNKLSEYVRAAAAGETVLVTDRDRVVAHLVPPPAGGALSDQDLITIGIREGWLTPATQRGPLPAPDYLPIVSFDQLMEDLAKDREDR